MVAPPGAVPTVPAALDHRLDGRHPTGLAENHPIAGVQLKVKRHDKIDEFLTTLFL
jgi:hypothetical protein